MSKRLKVGVLLAGAAIVLAAFPALAGAPGTITLTSPSAATALRGAVPITWTYVAGDIVKSTSSVQVDVKAGPVWSTLGTAPITDGSFSWDTTGIADGVDHVARVTVVGTTRKSEASPVIVDNTAPDIAVTAEPVCLDVWCNDASVLVSVLASDATSGLAIDPTGDVEVTEEGFNELSFTATDVAGNSKTVDVTVPLDRTVPDLGTAVSPAECADGAWCAAPTVTVSVASSDALSGLASDPTGDVEVSAEGVSTLDFEAIDVAGNAATTSVTIRLDRTGAETTINADDVLARPLGDELTGTASDAGAGVAGTTVRFVTPLSEVTEIEAACTGCGTNASTWIVDTTALLPGFYTVTATSKDLLGNEGEPTPPITMIVL